MTESASTKPVAWITGSGAKRVGQAIAREFASAGYRIVIHANHSVEETRQFAEELLSEGNMPLLVNGDVSDPKTSRTIVDLVLATMGRLDVLVNSAAVWNSQPFEEMTAEDIRKEFEVNTLGTLLCSQAAGLAMVKQPTGGAIVLIGDWAVQRPYPKFASYFASKGAIETMTRSLAVELGTKNPSVRVNAILPGPVLLDESIPPETAERIRQQALVKRHGSPEDVGRAALFLATQPFITGVCLPVDGGRSIYAGDSLDAIAHPKFAGGTAC